MPAENCIRMPETRIAKRWEGQKSNEKTKKKTKKNLKKQIQKK